MTDSRSRWVTGRSAHALLTLACALALLFALQSDTSAQDTRPAKGDAWSSTDCAEFGLENVPESAGIECGYVAAPLRHAEADGETIQLAVVIIPSHDADRQPDPLFMGQGGPGGSTIDTYAEILATDVSYRPATNRDIVLWDQRGTLHSVPALLCPEVTDEALQDAEQGVNPSDEESIAAFAACKARLGGVTSDLSAFNSQENADDAESIRQALGYDTFNFYGVSYGTELGQFIIRQQPDHLRSVILDAVVPLTYNLFTEPAFAKDRIARKYFESCAADAECNAAFPNLAERYVALIDRLNENPVALTIAPMDLAPQTTRVRLTGDELESTLYEGLYTDLQPLMPLIVDSADKGDFTLLSSFLLPAVLLDDTFSLGTYTTVACAERGSTDPTAVDYSEIYPRIAESETASAAQQLEICREWQIQLLPEGSTDLVQSEIPVLLLSGEFDPITPPEYAEQLLPGFPNAQHVVFTTGSHGQAVSNPCANGIISSFLDDPATQVDGACANAPVPEYVTPGNVIALPGVRNALGDGGLLGWSSIWLVAGTVPALLGAFFMLSAWIVYLFTWVLRGNKKPNAGEATRGWTLAWAAAAPWLAVAAATVLAIFFVGLYIALGTEIMTNQNLVMMGMVTIGWRWLFFLPPVAFLLVVGMVVSLVALWKGRHRTQAGRMYYTLLTLGALAGVWSLFSLGVLWNFAG